MIQALKSGILILIAPPTLMTVGVIFATMISKVLAGDMSSCSIVPRSRSLTIVSEATRAPRSSNLPAFRL